MKSELLLFTVCMSIIAGFFCGASFVYIVDSRAEKEHAEDERKFQTAICDSKVRSARAEGSIEGMDYASRLGHIVCESRISVEVVHHRQEDAKECARLIHEARFPR